MWSIWLKVVQNNSHRLSSFLDHSLIWLSNNCISYLNVMQFSSKSNQLWNKQDMQTFKLLQNVSTPPFQPRYSVVWILPKRRVLQLVDCSTCRWLWICTTQIRFQDTLALRYDWPLKNIPSSWPCGHQFTPYGWIFNHTSQWNEGHNRFFAHWSLPWCFNRTSLATLNRRTLTVSHCKCERQCQTRYCN